MLELRLELDLGVLLFCQLVSCVGNWFTSKSNLIMRHGVMDLTLVTAVGSFVLSL